LSVRAKAVESEMKGPLTERYDDRIAGVLSCYDRVVVTGTLPTVCYAAGMTKFLYAIGVRIFDYPQFASGLRDRVRERAASLAAAAEITIEHVAKATSARRRSLRRCWNDGANTPAWCMSSRRGGVQRLSALARQADAQDLRAAGQRQVPTLLFLFHRCRAWPGLSAGADMGAVPPAILLQRSQLAGASTAAEGISFTAADNAFTRIDNWQRARDLADRLSPDRLHLVLDRYAARCCPVLEVFRQSYYWSLMQVEYATDPGLRRGRLWCSAPSGRSSRSTNNSPASRC
jgi:hypothetical protein